MSNFVLLNNIEHKNLRVIRAHSAEYGDNEMSAVVFPQEFRAVQNEYPIFFQKNSETGKFYAIALFGLRQQENLFLTEFGWDAHYVPASVKRGPFVIGVQPPKPGDDPTKPNLMVYIDTASPRLSETAGDAVFLPQGGYSAYLESIVDLLDYIKYGSDLSEGFIVALLEYDLLELVSVEIVLKNGEQNNLTGMYTLNEDKLKGLGASALAALHSKGYLEFIYMSLASQANVAKLITRIERRL